MPPRSKKITSKLLAKTIRQSPPTLQPQQVPEEEEEEPKVSADLNEMADSSNGKLDGAENVQPEDVGDSKPVVESVRDVAVDDCSEPAKETRDDADDSSSSSSSSSDEEAEGARVANDSGEVEETEEVVVSVVETVESVYNHLDQGSVVVETKVEEEEKVAESLDETGESSPAIAEEVLKQVDEKTLSYVEESNGVALVETDLVSKEDEKEAVPAAVADIVSKGIEETRLPVSKEQTGESSGTAYKEEVPAVESADAGQDHGKAEIPESTGNPSIVSVAGPPPAADFMEELLWTLRNSAPKIR